MKDRWSEWKDSCISNTLCCSGRVHDACRGQRQNNKQKAEESLESHPDSDKSGLYQCACKGSLLVCAPAAELHSTRLCQASFLWRDICGLHSSYSIRLFAIRSAPESAVNTIVKRPRGDVNTGEKEPFRDDAFTLGRGRWLRSYTLRLKELKQEQEQEKTEHYQLKIIQV